LLSSAKKTRRMILYEMNICNSYVFSYIFYYRFNFLLQFNKPHFIWLILIIVGHHVLNFKGITKDYSGELRPYPLATVQRG
jgi:hypothetical protein